MRVKTIKLVPFMAIYGERDRCRVRVREKELHIPSGKKRKKRKKKEYSRMVTWERRKEKEPSLWMENIYLDGYHGFYAASRYWAMSSVSRFVGSSVGLSAIKLIFFYFFALTEIKVVKESSLLIRHIFHKPEFLKLQ